MRSNQEYLVQFIPSNRNDVAVLKRVLKAFNKAPSSEAPVTVNESTGVMLTEREYRGIITAIECNSNKYLTCNIAAYLPSHAPFTSYHQ